MKLFLLTRDGWYDEIHGMLIRARSEDRARALSNIQSADEGKIWTDMKKVDCQIVNVNGDEEIILIDFHAG